jgi:hypothetical protein
MAERNIGVPEDRRMLFRIGINLGDILIDGEDILGDGVNVAARWRGSPNPAAFASLHPLTNRFAARSRSISLILASKASRISPISKLGEGNRSL